MINNDIYLQYTKYYKGKKLSKLYPTEFVVRSFLGTYPNLKPNAKTFYKGKPVGRNMLVTPQGKPVSELSTTLTRKLLDLWYLL